MSNGDVYEGYDYQTEPAPQPLNPEQVYLNDDRLFGPTQQIKKEVDDFSKWQLETEHMIYTVTMTLMGYRKKVSEVEGEKDTWELAEKDPTLSRAGAYEVNSQLFSVLNPNIFLSNLTEYVINRFTRNIVGNIIIRLGTDTAKYGIRDANGVDDETKLYKVKDIVEPALYSALCRANKWKTLEMLNQAHEIRELKTNQSGSRWPFSRQPQMG